MSAAMASELAALGATPGPADAFMERVAEELGAAAARATAAEAELEAVRATLRVFQEELFFVDAERDGWTLRANVDDCAAVLLRPVRAGDFRAGDAPDLPPWFAEVFGEPALRTVRGGATAFKYAPGDDPPLPPLYGVRLASSLAPGLSAAARALAWAHPTDNAWLRQQLQDYVCRCLGPLVVRVDFGALAATLRPPGNG